MKKVYKPVESLQIGESAINRCKKGSPLLEPCKEKYEYLVKWIKEKDLNIKSLMIGMDGDFDMVCSQMFIDETFDDMRKRFYSEHGIDSSFWAKFTAEVMTDKEYFKVNLSKKSKTVFC